MSLALTYLNNSIDIFIAVLNKVILTAVEHNISVLQSEELLRLRRYVIALWSIAVDLLCFDFTYRYISYAFSSKNNSF